MFLDDHTDASFETHSCAMRPVFATAARVAPLMSTVLITGEAGVGKEWLARWIHAHSARADRPFVRLDLGVFDDRTHESYLPEYWGGAFTRLAGAIFDAAAGGTLFLDEISDVPRDMQMTLVHVIDEQGRRAGDVLPPRLDVRLIAATTRNLEKEMTQRWFRPAVFYSLPEGLYIPPLRERPGDLWILAHGLLDRAVARRHRPPSRFAPQAMAHLLSYDWPGNVRELEETIEQACVVAAGPEIQAKDLPDAIQRGGESTPSEETDPFSGCAITSASGERVH
jgi:DNA-binding NtrC family response regulator